MVGQKRATKQTGMAHALQFFYIVVPGLLPRKCMHQYCDYQSERGEGEVVLQFNQSGANTYVDINNLSHNAVFYLSFRGLNSCEIQTDMDEQKKIAKCYHTKITFP